MDTLYGCHSNSSGFFKAPEQFLHIPGGPLKTQSWNYTFVDTAVRPLKTVLDYTSTVAHGTP
jgi:hypothetical protein